MNIENMLREYPHISENIQNLNRELNIILQNKEETYNTLKAQGLTGMPHGTDISDQVYNAVERLVDRYGVRAKEITAEINAWMDVQQIITQIYFKADLLTMEERRIIDLRYFNQYKWTRIPYIMKYSLPQCERFRKSALDKMSAEFAKMRENDGKSMIA